MSLFALTAKFSEAVRLVNGIPPTKLPLLLNRIIGSIQVEHTRAFTEGEESQLRSLFGLDVEGLRTVLESCAYVFEQAAYAGAGDALLAAQLLDVGLAEAQAAAFQQVWLAEGRAMVGRLKLRQLGGSPTLASSGWEVRLNMGYAGKATHEPSTLLTFNVSSGAGSGAAADVGAPAAAAVAASAGSGGSGAAGAPVVDTFAVEFSKSELLALLEKLDRMQAQLDSLSAR